MLSGSLYDPDTLLRKGLARISKTDKVAFLSAMIAGVLVHLYMLTNDLPNHDAIGQQFATFKYHISQGRWFHWVLASIAGNVRLPLMNGLLGILYLSITATLISHFVFSFKKILYSGLFGVLFLVFPTVISLMMFGALFDSFFLGLLLGVVGIVLSVRFKYGFLLGVSLMILSIATYQSFFSYFAAIYVLLVISQIVEGSPTAKTVKNGMRYIAYLMATMGIYLWSVQKALQLTGRTMSDRVGLNSIGSIDLSKISSMIAESYRCVGEFFFNDAFLYHLSWFRYAFLIVAVFCIFAIGVICYHKGIHKNLVSTLALVGCVVLFPLSTYLIPIMAPELKFQARSIYPFVLFFGLALYLLDQLHTFEQRKKMTMTRILNCFTHAFSWTITIFIVCVIFQYAITDNIIIKRQQFAFENTYAFLSRMTATVQNTEGYDRSMTMYYIGYPVADFFPPYPLDEYGKKSTESDRNLVTPPSAYRFLSDYMAFPNPLIRIENDDDLLNLQLSEETQNALEGMALYPDYGSVRIFEEGIFIKFR